MFPSELIPGNKSYMTSPRDILDYIVTEEMLSVDFSMEGKTKGVVLGIQTIDKVDTPTKASCDRLKSTEILKIRSVQIEGYNFIMQAINKETVLLDMLFLLQLAKIQMKKTIAYKLIGL